MALTTTWRKAVRLALALMALGYGCAWQAAWADTPFVVKDVRVEGTQRINVGTVLNYLPLAVGDTADEARVAQAVRSLFKTGFFEDVRLSRDDGDVLVVTLKERPSIHQVKISGNRDIATDKLTEAMKQAGLAEGKIFDRALLDKVERELQRQYFSQGKYGVKIASTTTPLERNRVDVSLEIDEGAAARIREITLIGNHAFPTDTLLLQLQLSPATWWAPFSSSDQYSKQKQTADQETLRSYYMDRGYVNFAVDSTQVTITPDKQDIFVTLNITEGERYTIKEVKLTGNLVVPEAELRTRVGVHAGEVFSRRLITEDVTKLSERLGQDGYAFANITPVPDIDKQTKQVSLTYVIDPAKRVYVRRVNVAGNAKTQDEVIRREVRQMEGGWLDTAKLNRSRIRLQRLGYFDEVNIETPAVPGTADQVDVDISVTEGSFGNFTATAGFAQGSGVILSASINMNNFLGSGKRVTAEVNNSKANTVYSFALTDPYYTESGISRSIRAFFRKTEPGRVSVASYTSDVFGGGVGYDIPLSEHNSANFGVDVEHTQVKATSSTPSTYRDFLTTYGDTFDILKLSTGWSHDTRDRVIFPETGLYQGLGIAVAAPGSGLEFYKLSSNTKWYYPLPKGFTLSLKNEIGYGHGYGGTSALPFFENYYAGGPGSVRGYIASRLGPKENDRALGGAFKVLGSAEIVLPASLFENTKTFRLSLFTDIGNVYRDIAAFNTSELRYSSGVSATWLSPLGPLVFSLSRPLNRQSSDETRAFQFTLGTFF